MVDVRWPLRAVVTATHSYPTRITLECGHVIPARAGGQKRMRCVSCALSDRPPKETGP